ncbi:protein pyrBI [Lactonifactor longoviformis]|uniref:Protein pyrBI n=1 Tax=Lactonifactor longoviformis DSM 17459 TaxID=1122155 RepID=A0A1M4ZSQ3_9CLOT|nr:protein pyrBI [Lactonifactor longoviformis]POP30636.1 protein pyrBI [Lactonifactor longoviformis]SHF21120.1 hypothetical protein SAMN02745158_02904 [Lactonifactor longoviformis DSM 17459]
MRRITSACLLQTMKFDAMNNDNSEQELEIFCNKLNKKGTKYTIESKEKQGDGSIVVKLKKQYNAYKTDGYLD